MFEIVVFAGHSKYLEVEISCASSFSACIQSHAAKNGVDAGCISCCIQELKRNCSIVYFYIYSASKCIDIVARNFSGYFSSTSEVKICLMYSYVTEFKE